MIVIGCSTLGGVAAQPPGAWEGGAPFAKRGESGTAEDCALRVESGPMPGGWSWMTGRWPISEFTACRSAPWPRALGSERNFRRTTSRPTINMCWPLGNTPALNSYSRIRMRPSLPCAGRPLCSHQQRGPIWIHSLRLAPPLFVTRRSHLRSVGGGRGTDGSRTSRKKHPLCEIGWWRSWTAGSGSLGKRRDLDLVSEAGELAGEVAGFGLFALNERRPTGGPVRCLSPASTLPPSRLSLSPS